MNKGQIVRNYSDKVIIKRFMYYLKDHISSIIIALCLMFLVVGMNVFLPLISKVVLTELGKENFDINLIIAIIMGYAALMVGSYIFQYIQSLVLTKMGQQVMYNIREDVFKAIENYSIDQINNIPNGKLVTRVTSDTNAINQMYTSLIITLIKNVLTILSTLVTIFILNYKLAFLVISLTPILMVTSFIFRKYSRKAYREVRGNVSKVNAYLSENLSGMKIIQVFNQEDKKFKEFEKVNKELRKSSLKEIWIFSIFRPFIYVLYMTTLLLVVYFGSKQNIANGLTNYAIIITFQQYIGRIFDPIQVLADQFNVLQSAFAASERILEVMDQKPTVVDSDDAIDVEHIKGDIEFKNVWFSYIPNEWVLKDISFKINANDTVAFVGATGSGKSTILSLIVRNYDIQRGQILIDGIDIKKIKITSLRKNIGQMLQDVFIFSGTIFSNIQMNDESITMEEVKKASEYVNLAPFIEKLPNKYNEVVKERGNNFSNGQRQLLSFARTIVYKPSVMILDEATANIDTETEVLIQDSLEKMSNIGTMIIVAHRLSTIQHANKIFVIKNGELIEQGNHQELLHNKGYYYKLYQLQYEKKFIENDIKD
ncbi:MAG: ABC transporter ATP-binding protein/permease [Acholeplasmataceae bacterium]|nr:ABC transporter ATP-binding protein/permease [Acholeplasmataceae bacterium]